MTCCAAAGSQDVVNNRRATNHRRQEGTASLPQSKAGWTRHHSGQQQQSGEPHAVWLTESRAVFSLAYFLYPLHQVHHNPLPVMTLPGRPSTQSPGRPSTQAMIAGHATPFVRLDEQRWRSKTQPSFITSIYSCTFNYRFSTSQAAAPTAQFQRGGFNRSSGVDGFLSSRSFG